MRTQFSWEEQHIWNGINGMFLIRSISRCSVKDYKYTKTYFQIEKAFEPGYDPALEIASHANASSVPGVDEEHLRRKEQDLVDRIISGQEKGHYYLLLGQKVLIDLSNVALSQIN